MNSCLLGRWAKIVTVASMLSLLCVTSAWAENLADSIDDGTHYYLRLSGGMQTVGGDFRGRVESKSPVKGDQYFEIFEMAEPIIENGESAGLTLGGQKGRLAGEISWFTAQQDTKMYQKFELSVGKADVTKIGINCKYCLRDPEKTAIVPFVQIGVEKNDFRIGDGALNTEKEKIPDPKNPQQIIEGKTLRSFSGSCTYSGLGYNLGLGVTFRVNKQWVIDASYVATMINSIDLRAFAKNYTTDLTAKTGLFCVGVNYYF